MARAFAFGALVVSAQELFLSQAPKELLERVQQGQATAAQQPAGPRPTHFARHSLRSRTPPPGALRVSPMDHGGDPTGVKDSTDALLQCVATCANRSALSPNGVFPGSRSFGNGKVVKDMGGCYVDLEGGEYRISQTIDIPEYNANMQLGFGSIIAGPDFPQDKFLLSVGGVTDGCKVPQGSCNIDINFPELFLDGSRRASGMQINNVMGVTVGPGGYFLNFTKYGIQINGGHEVMTDRVWLGETNFDFDHRKEGAPPNATAIEINGNDHYVLNTIVFSSKVGVAVHGAADYVEGTHVWFPYNVALAFKDIGAMAFHITGGQNRFNGCYIDGGRAVFEGSGLKNNIWMNGFECCANIGGVNHGIILKGDSIGPGLHLTHNIFQSGSIFHESASTSAPSSLKVQDVRIEHNYFHDTGRGSRARLSQDVTKATNVSFNFCDHLVFPQIVYTSVDVVAASGFPRAIARPAQGCIVNVETDQPVTGRITVLADSSEIAGYLV